MDDDHFNEGEGASEASTDRALEERARDPTDQDPQSSRDGRQGLEANGNIDPEGDGRSSANDLIDGELLDEVADRVTENTMAVYSYSGPLPPSSEFASYEKVLPGAADRILFMAEESARAAAEATKADAAATRAAAESVAEDGR